LNENNDTKLTINELIKSQIEQKLETKQIYKVNIVRPGQDQESSSENSQAMRTVLQHRFLSFKVKTIEFDGKLATAIFLTDSTKKTIKKLLKMEMIEKLDHERIAAIFSSTVIQEMLKPLQSILFFIAQLEIYVRGLE